MPVFLMGGWDLAEEPPPLVPSIAQARESNPEFGKGTVPCLETGFSIDYRIPHHGQRSRDQRMDDAARFRARRGMKQVHHERIFLREKPADV